MSKDTFNISEQIYESLKKSGAEIGNASIPIIKKVLDENLNKYKMFLVNFKDYKKQTEWRDTFVAINETELAIKIKSKYEYSEYHIIGSYDII